MYDNLLQLPLFQGLCKNDFTTILEKVKFNFLSYERNENIARQNTPCDRLIFLLKGEITSHTAYGNPGYALSETFIAPCTIELHSLFGKQTLFSASYKAKTDVKILSIDKSYIFSQLNNYEIFRLNFLNILSSRCQHLEHKLWMGQNGTLEEKFVHFMQARCQHTQGEKNLHITMEELADLIDETRINVSRMLNDMQKKGLVLLKRKAISINNLEMLANSVAHISSNQTQS